MAECLKYIEHLVCQVEESREKPNKKKKNFRSILIFNIRKYYITRGKKSLGVINEKTQNFTKIGKHELLYQKADKHLA